MYQQWPWGGTAAASPTTGYVQPAASGQVAAPQWPAGFSQYAVTPEVQQQWAAWASQAQYAYGSSVPVGQVPTTTTYTGGYPEYQTASNDARASQLSDSNVQTSGQKNPTEELVQQDVSESEKLKQLKEKAQQWKTLQQPVTASWSYSTAATGVTVNATTVTSSADSLKPHVLSNVNAPESASSQTQMDKEEEEFERQFKEWEKQFEAWKEQNINHPDKEAFAQYEKQWQEWRAQLLQKKEQMQKARAERLAAQTAHSDGITQVTSAGNSVGVNSVTGANVPDPAAAASSNPNMYYPATQYMYMQPYMYPGNVPVPQSVPQQYPYGPPPTTSSGENYTNQTHAMPPVESGVLVPPTSSENLNMDNKGMKNFDHGRERPKPAPGRKNNSREDEMFQSFEGYENSASYPSEPEENYQRDWKYPPPQGPAPAAPPPMRGRGRGGRGRGRARGRGGPDRWSDAPGPEIKPRPGGDINPRPIFPEGLGEFPDGAMSGPPAPPSEFEYPPEDFREEFPLEEMPYPEDCPRRGFPPEDRFPFHDGPQPFPRDEFDKPFPPPPHPFDDRFHPEAERFQPPGPLLEDGFERDFDRYPPDDDMYGLPPPPFRDDFPPFEERFPPNRGRFPGRGRRFPRGAEFDRFGPPPFPPSMRDDGPFCPPNHPEFLPPPDDRFGFPGDMPPRMPPGRGMRPPFEPGFPSSRGRFPDEHFYGDGPPPRFKSIDYTHRPASVVMGEDFDPHYEYESEFQDDVMQYRAGPPKRKKWLLSRTPTSEKKIDD